MPLSRLQDTPAPGPAPRQATFTLRLVAMLTRV